MAADRSEDDEGHSHGRFDDALDFFSINEGGAHRRLGPMAMTAAMTVTGGSANGRC
jgi:hypothetical protein